MKLNENKNIFEDAMKLLIHNSHRNLKDFYKSYQEAYNLGKEIIPYIRQHLLDGDWKEINITGKMQYLTVFMILLHDIDENESRKLRDELLNNKKCNEIVAIRLNSICSFRIDDFQEFQCNGIRLLINKKLKKIRKIQNYLINWLNNINSENLKNIDRIYILKKDQGDYLGLFQQILEVITVFWELPIKSIEYCFYHEIGHYLDKYIADENLDREWFADFFAQKIFIKNHSFICAPFLKYLLLPLIFRKIKLDHWKKMLTISPADQRTAGN